MPKIPPHDPDEFFDPFGDQKSPMEAAFREVDSEEEEDTEPETVEQAELSKVSHTLISTIIASFFSMRQTGILSAALPLLQEVWYDYVNDCPHLTLRLRIPFEEAPEALLEAVRWELRELGDLLAPVFDSRVALSLEVCDDEPDTRAF